MEPSALSADRIKESQKKHWNAVAPGWEKWADWTDRNFGPLIAWLGETTGWRSGARILDVACGTGFPALPAARAIRPDGHVSAIDVSPNMLEAAARLAQAQTLDNVQFLEMDAEDLRFDDRTFDAAICTCGLMFYPNPTRALAEMRRVLKPDGCAAIVVWAEPEQNPFSTVMVEALGRFVALPPPPVPSSPGPFRFGPPGTLESVVRDAGFSDVTIEDRALLFDFGSAAEYLEVVADVTGWKRRIDTLSVGDIAELMSVLTEAVQPYLVDGRVRVPATARCASARP